MTDSTGDHLTVLQSQVNEVVGVMTQNVDKLLAREEKLDEAIDKSEKLKKNVGLLSLLHGPS